jgi:hypothetical protein
MTYGIHFMGGISRYLMAWSKTTLEEQPKNIAVLVVEIKHVK